MLNEPSIKNNRGNNHHNIVSNSIDQFSNILELNNK